MAKDVRKKVVTLRVSEPEWIAIQEAAQADGMKVRSWIRHRIFTGEVKKATYKGYRE